MSKLIYKVLGKREVVSETGSQDEYDIEWTHEGGSFKNTVDLPVGTTIEYDGLAVSDVKHHYKTVELEPLKVIKDQVNVMPGAQLSYVMQLCEEKRARLAKALGVEP